MDIQDLRTKLETWPRLSYGRYPTPLEPLPRLSNQLGGPQLWIKRDDVIGPGLGGNKARKLEFLMADAVELGKKKAVTVGGLQSNHVRMTAAACAPLGIQAHIIHFAKKPEKMQGNQFLNHLFGAKIHYVPFGGGSDGSMTIETSSRLAKYISTLLVGPGAYFIPVGGHAAIGCLGYVDAAFELHEQAVELGMLDQQVTVVTAAGTGGTLAGLFAGFFLANSPIDVVGIDIGKLWKAFPVSIASLVGELCNSFGEHNQFQAVDIPIIEKKYVGPKYAAATPETLSAIRLLAQSQGIILDPVYTGKAFAGMVDLVRSGHFQDDEHVIFIHTGGYPAMWAYEETLAGQRP